MSCPSTAEQQERLDNEWHALLFGVRRSIRYHFRRRMFFERVRQFTTIIVFLSGSAAFAALLKEIDTFYPTLAAAVATLFSLIDLVVGTESMRRHDDLGHRFMELKRRMEVAQGPPDTQSLKRFTAHRLDIEMEEPPIHQVLDAICHNEVLRAMGYERSHFLRIRFYQRWLAHFFDIQDHKIMTYADLEKTQ